MTFLSKLNEALTTFAENYEQAQRNAELNIDANSIASLIKQARLTRDLTTDQLAEVTGIRSYRIRQLEMDSPYLRTVTLDELVQIKKALRISNASIAKFVADAA